MLENTELRQEVLPSGIATYSQGTGEPLLMIHGIMSDGSFFHDTMKILSEVYQTISYDRRGYGNSIREGETDYTVKSQAEDAAQVLQHYTKEPAWIIGTSAGGQIAMELAITHPELIKGLILVETPMGYKEEIHQELADWNALLNRYISEGKTKKILPAFVEAIGGSVQKGKKLSLQELGKSYRNLHSFAFGEINEIQRYLPPEEKVRQLQVPVFMGISERGRETMFARAARSAAEYMNFSVFHLPGYHNTVQELPEEFAFAVMGLLLYKKYIIGREIH